MIRFIGPFDTAGDYTLQFTTTRTHTYTHISVHSHVFASLYLVAAPNADVYLPLGSRTIPDLCCQLLSTNCLKVKIKVTFWLAVYRLLVLPDVKPLKTHNQRFFQLNPCGHSPYVTSSLTRRWVCLLFRPFNVRWDSGGLSLWEKSLLIFMFQRSHRVSVTFRPRCNFLRT
jgi:hypothetical protein